MRPEGLVRILSPAPASHGGKNSGQPAPTKNQSLFPIPLPYPLPLQLYPRASWIQPPSDQHHDTYEDNIIQYATVVLNRGVKNWSLILQRRHWRNPLRRRMASARRSIIIRLPGAYSQIDLLYHLVKIAFE